MRIIAGKCGGRHINPPRTSRIRPTTDRIKQMIFDALGYPFHFSRVLDLFAGTGNLGLEAMSRGARSVVFVDNSSMAIKTIAANCQLLSLSASSKIIQMDVFRALNQFSKKSEKFDLIFADPPYRKMYVHQLLAFFDTAQLLSETGILVLEHASLDIPQINLVHIQLLKHKKTGETSFSFYSSR